MPTDALREPWRSFLRELDAHLARPTELHCFGGFVVAECYGLTRATADIDVLESRGTNLADLGALAGLHSALHRRHKVFIDVVTVADVPDNYEERLTAVLDAAFVNLRLRVFERHDLVLAKLQGITTATGRTSKPWRRGLDWTGHRRVCGNVIVTSCATSSGGPRGKT